MSFDIFIMLGVSLVAGLLIATQGLIVESIYLDISHGISKRMSKITVEVMIVKVVDRTDESYNRFGIYYRKNLQRGYMVTFERLSSDRKHTLLLPGHRRFEMLSEGGQGILTYQGVRFIGFEPFNPEDN